MATKIRNVKMPVVNVSIIQTNVPLAVIRMTCVMDHLTGNVAVLPVVAAMGEINVETMDAHIIWILLVVRVKQDHKMG